MTNKRNRVYLTNPALRSNEKGEALAGEPGGGKKGWEIGEGGYLLGILDC